jgi:hypothetical protein
MTFICCAANSAELSCLVAAAAAGKPLGQTIKEHIPGEGKRCRHLNQTVAAVSSAINGAAMPIAWSFFCSS